MNPIRNLLTSYAKAYNKMYKRKGALFIDYIKREKLEEENEIKSVVRYIHQMPVSNHLATDPEKWRWSSFNAYLYPQKTTHIQRDFVLSLFQHQNEMLQFHY